MVKVSNVFAWAEGSSPLLLTFFDCIISLHKCYVYLNLYVF